MTSNSPQFPSLTPPIPTPPPSHPLIPLRRSLPRSSSTQEDWRDIGEDDTAGPELSCRELRSLAKLDDVLAGEREWAEVSFDREPLGADEGGVPMPGSGKGITSDRIIGVLILFDDVHRSPATPISCVVIKPVFVSCFKGILSLFVYRS